MINMCKVFGGGGGWAFPSVIFVNKFDQTISCVLTVLALGIERQNADALLLARGVIDRFVMTFQTNRWRSSGESRSG